MARQGKIARLPHKLRQAINIKLLDGKLSRTILPWLNSQPEAIALWEAHFEGAPANPQNLSEWRRGGYAEWLQRKQKSENLKTLASYASDLAKAGGNISEGAAAIAGGKILEILESGADSEDLDLSKLVASVTSLREMEIENAKLKLSKRKESNREKVIELSIDKFQKQTVTMFMRWARSKEAQAILNNGKPKGIQMDALRKMIFGTRKETNE